MLQENWNVQFDRSAQQSQVRQGNQKEQLNALASTRKYTSLKLKYYQTRWQRKLCDRTTPLEHEDNVINVECEESIYFTYSRKTLLCYRN